MDIDLVNVSVPSDSSICGVRPEGGTMDDAWTNTALWTEKDVLFWKTKLLPLPDDPGHLRWKATNP